MKKSHYPGERVVRDSLLTRINVVKVTSLMLGFTHDGILCFCDTLKNAVRLTFPKGAQMKDPHKLFNTRLDSKTARAIDFHEGDPINEAALQALMLEAVGLNKSKAHEPSFYESHDL